MTTFFEHQRTSYKRSYLRNLICLATTDGFLDDSEKDLIQEIGLRRGLKKWQIAELLGQLDTCEDVFIPKTLSNQMTMLYDLMQIIYADNQVNSNEVLYFDSVINEFNLHPDLVTELKTMFHGNLPTADQWKEFVMFVCEDAGQKS